MEHDEPKLSATAVKLERLRTMLLQAGGCQVLLPSIEDDLDKILARGRLWRPAQQNIRMMPGAASQCHMNSALCWDANQDLCTIATGYGLSDDGAWRQHSWVVKTDGKETIVETTEKRIAYFGFLLDTEECAEFFGNNL